MNALTRVMHSHIVSQRQIMLVKNDATMNVASSILSYSAVESFSLIIHEHRSIGKRSLSAIYAEHNSVIKIARYSAGKMHSFH